MKTITLQGEFQKFENLKQATSKFDEDRLPYEVETRVYVLDIDSLNSNSADELSDDEFQTLAEEEGRVYTLQGFQEAFNFTEINSSIDVIRFINITI
jgi:hypothetical protein